MAEASQRFDAIVYDFEVALATLSEVLQHIEDAKPNGRLRVVILNNTIVALTATIEEALRGLFREYLSILEESFEDHRTLRLALQKSNLNCAIQDLRKYNNNEDFKTAAILLSNLEKCLTGQSGYQLLKEQLTYNQRNFKSQQVTEVSKNVGVSGLWQRICDCPEIEEFTGESVLDARVTRLTAQWNRIFEERDLVVHRISQASGWASDLIQLSIDLSKVVIKRIACCLSIDAEEFRNQHANQGS